MNITNNSEKLKMFISNQLKKEYYYLYLSLY